jgi:hypothetical protein
LLSGAEKLFSSNSNEEPKMNEWDGFNYDPFKLAATGTTLGTRLLLAGTSTGGFTQPMTNPLAAASVGNGLFQTR